MFTQLPAAPNILAYLFSGTITAEDVDRVYDDMRRVFGSHDKVSIFAELIDDFDMDFAKAIMIQFLDEEKPRKLMADISIWLVSS